MRVEPFLLSVVDCVWNCIAGNDSAERKFLDARGVLTLLSMLEVNDVSSKHCRIM